MIHQATENPKNSLKVCSILTIPSPGIQEHPVENLAFYHVPGCVYSTLKTFIFLQAMYGIPFSILCQTKS